VGQLTGHRFHRSDPGQHAGESAQVNGELDALPAGHNWPAGGSAVSFPGSGEAELGRCRGAQCAVVAHHDGLAWGGEALEDGRGRERALIAFSRRESVYIGRRWVGRSTLTADVIEASATRADSLHRM
jgi:hypothetical protein